MMHFHSLKNIRTGFIASFVPFSKRFVRAFGRKWTIGALRHSSTNVQLTKKVQNSGVDDLLKSMKKLSLHTQSSIKVTITYPQVLKMSLLSELNLPCTTSLQEMKKAVFNDFWKVFAKAFPKSEMLVHGKIEHIRITQEEKAVDSDEALQTCLRATGSFQAVFKTH